MAIGTALFLVGVLFFAIVFRGFRQFMVACGVIASIGFIVLAIGSEMSADKTSPWWILPALTLVLVLPFLILHAIGKVVQYVRKRLTANKPIQKGSTFASCWNTWKAARPGVDPKALDRELADVIAEAKREHFPPT